MRRPNENWNHHSKWSEIIFKIINKYSEWNEQPIEIDDKFPEDMERIHYL